MTPFELAQPRSLAEAIRLLDPDDETVRPIAGGTALMLMMKAGVFRPAKLVSLRKIESKYGGIATTADGLVIGAMTTLADLERSSEVRQHAPIITQTMLTLSNVRVRNVATVGGARRTKRWGKPNSSRTCAARSPISASSCVSMSDARCRRAWTEAGAR